MEKSKAYIVAAVLSLSFYIIGVLSGLVIENSAKDYAEEREKTLQRQLENLQLEYAYLSIAGKDMSCDSLSMLVSENTRRVRELGTELDSGIEEFEELRRQYAFLSTKAWILSRYMNEKCGEKKAVVLYFYSVPCDECIEQGLILDELGARNFTGMLEVFVLNANLEEPIITTLMKTNNVSTTPAMVINNMTYNGLVERENLKKILEDSIGS